MSGRRARALCPHAVVVRPRMSAYAEASKAVSEVFEQQQVGLPITVGVARTKFLAKVAGAFAKPDGLLVVPPDGELAFLHPLPVTRARAQSRSSSPSGWAGGAARSGPSARSAVGRRARRVCRRVVLRLRFDLSRATRSHTLPRPTAHTQVILATARWLLVTAMPAIERRGVTLVGLSLANLDEDDALQLGLPFAPHRASELDATVDRVRERFGSDAIARAVLVARDPGLTMPPLPD